MQICGTDQQSFHPFEQGSMQLKRKGSKDAHIWTKHIFWLRKVWHSFCTSWGLQRMVENHSGCSSIWDYLT